VPAEEDLESSKEQSEGVDCEADGCLHVCWEDILVLKVIVGCSEMRRKGWKA
jgi:hypothetical protein